MQDYLASKVSLSPILFATLILSLTNPAYAQNATSSPLGKYAELSTYCGKQRASVDAATIPEFGCFVLSSGHSATGTFSGHQVEVSVNEKGEEVFTVDGTLVTDLSDPHRQPPRFTNLPYVHNLGMAGYGICKDPNSFGCPTQIVVFSRNPNKTVLFMMSECMPPEYKVCVNSKEGWDYETSRR